MTKLISNHDWVTMAVILVRILITKPLIFKKVGGWQAVGWVGRTMGGRSQARQASSTT